MSEDNKPQAEIEELELQDLAAELSEEEMEQVTGGVRRRPAN